MPSSDAQLPVGRLAPSPTGLLHLGHARSFLLAWLWSRARGGRVVLRMEDLDATRAKPELAACALRDLEWLGLDWDGEVLYQSRHHDELRGAAEELCERGLAYPCVCTRREVAEAIAAPHGPGSEGVYPGTCRDRYASLAEARRRTGREPCLRYRVPSGEVTVRDELLGDYVQDVAREVGDFPVTSRDGQVAYQLAVVLDDERQGVTDVLRGEDLLESTPRQALLLEDLWFERPRWAHVPLVTDAKGRRLAKRADDLSLASLAAGGLDPRRLVGWLAGTFGAALAEPGDAPRTPAELVAGFDLARLPRGPVAFDRATRRALGADA
ncbi:MAG: tRNA glutamyl-Q(34) synthetase GluQRS [Planctomycetes bacterium]|nr:tRNA glutamyl-Q(34) synthetase GluQRS [Planctomycetota bacterium]